MKGFCLFLMIEVCLQTYACCQKPLQILSYTVNGTGEHGTGDGLTLKQAFAFERSEDSTFCCYSEEVKKSRYCKSMEKALCSLSHSEVDSSIYTLHPPPEIVMILVIHADNGSDMLLVSKGCRTTIYYDGKWWKTNDDFWRFFKKGMPRKVRKSYMPFKGDASLMMKRGGAVYYR